MFELSVEPRRVGVIHLSHDDLRDLEARRGIERCNQLMRLGGPVVFSPKAMGTPDSLDQRG